MKDIETEFDGSRLIVRIPCASSAAAAASGLSPDGSELVPSSKPQPDSTLLKALPRAWQGMLEQGDYGMLTELADAERISRSYICRVLRLALLAPDIVERILDGRPTAGRAQFLKPFPAEWERQRDHLL